MKTFEDYLPMFGEAGGGSAGLRSTLKSFVNDTHDELVRLEKKGHSSLQPLIQLLTQTDAEWRKLCVSVSMTEHAGAFREVLEKVEPTAHELWRLAVGEVIIL